jgi:hypothetical protein
MNQARRRTLAEPLPARLATESGASAQLARRGDAEVLEVHAPDGALVFEYDGTRGKATLRIPAGDLRLEAPDGHIQLIAGRSIQCVAADEVALHSATAASLTVRDAAGRSAGLRVDGAAAALRAERIAVVADDAELRLRRTRFVGEVLHGGVERVELVMAKLESHVDRVVERAGNVFRYVKELNQLKAGRHRAQVDGAMQLDAGHVVMRAREDVHIDGEKINLG